MRLNYAQKSHIKTSSIQVSMNENDLPLNWLLVREDKTNCSCFNVLAFNSGYFSIQTWERCAFVCEHRKEITDISIIKRIASRACKLYTCMCIEYGLIFINDFRRTICVLVDYVLGIHWVTTLILSAAGYIILSM